MSTNNFTPIGTYIDNDKVEGSEWLFDNGDLLVPINKIKAGDNLSVIYNNNVGGGNSNATLLSLNHKKIYKDINIQAEIEFCDVYGIEEQTFEIITRSINKFDKRYSSDEYYALGYKDGSIYFTKYSYFLENQKSLVYTVLYNLDIEGQLRYFLDFTEEQKKLLFIDDKLKYNTKYIFDFSIKGDIITFRIKRSGSVVSQEIDNDWVTIIDNLDIKDNNTSVRNSTLDKVISVPVKVSNIDNKGFFGINVPNSHLKLYRVNVSPLDDSSSLNLYDDAEYSRQIATEFNFVFKNTERILLNSITGIKDNSTDILEVPNSDTIILDKRNVSNITKDDISKIQFNNYDLNSSQYSNKFINITNSSLDDFVGSSIHSYIGDNKELYGQYEQYLTLSSIDNSNDFELSSVDLSKSRNLPNSIIGDVLVELPSTIVYDESSSFKNNTVGIKEEDVESFITKEEIISKYGNEKFFLECTFRGERKIFELGNIADGSTKFDIDEEFLKVSPTYEAIWKYNVSYWIDTLANDITVSNLADTTVFGYSLLKYDYSIVEYIDNIVSDVYSITHTSYPNVRDYFDNIDNYSKENNIFISSIEDIFKALVYFNQGNSKDIVLNVIKKDTVFNSTFLTVKDSVPYSNNISYHNRFISFRNTWLNKAEDYRELSLKDRVYYISLNKDDYSLDLLNNKLSIKTIEQYNDKNVKLRLWSDNNILLTGSYSSNDVYYDIDSNIKDLYEDSSEEIYPKELYGVLDSDKIKTITNGSITYAVVPNIYLGSNEDRNLFVDLEVYSPFPEKSESVTRKLKVPLVKVEELLNFEISDTNTGSQFISGAPLNSTSNRLLDNIDYTLEEFHTIKRLNKYYPNPTNSLDTVTTYTAPTLLNGIEVTTYSLLTDYLQEQSITLTEDQWIYNEIEKVGFWEAINSPLLYQYALNDTFIDEILDVGKWFNVNDTKLGSYYKEVLSNIIDTKNKNKIKGELVRGDDEFNLDNWFDGFYTGIRSHIPTGEQTDTTTTTSPWGNQNSRFQLIQQLKDTLSNKFFNHTLFFVDLSNVVTDNNLGFGSNFIDSNIYPVGINEEFIHNPFVNSLALSGYAYNGSYDLSSLEVTISGNVVSDETDFSFIPLTSDFNEENKNSYTNLNNLTYTIKDVIFQINNNEDIFWGFNDSILLKDLPSGISVNSEYEYLKKGEDKPFFNKVNLGVTSGLGQDIFNYPNKNYIADSEIVNVNRIWFDNYEINDYNLVNVDNNTIQLVFNNIEFNNKPNISMKYRTDKLLDTTYKDTYIDNFNDKRQIKWTTLTNDKFGYSRISNDYIGFIKDVHNNEPIFRKGDMSKTNNDYVVKTGGTTTGRVKIKGLTIGRESENIISVCNVERKNNFEFYSDILFDNNISRGNMKTSFIFRGKFNLIDDAQYLSDYYEVSLNLEDNNVALLQKYYEDNEIKTTILATISESNNIIERGVTYTLSFSVIKDIFKVYLNKKKGKRQFLFEYDLLNGPNNDNLFSNTSELLGSLGVNFNKPTNFNSSGTKLGITTITDKVYFSNVKINTLSANNLTFGDTFISNSLDKEILNLKSSYKVKGNVSRIAKTDDNITVVLIGLSLFAKRGDLAGWIQLGRNVKDFRVVGVYIYVNEILSTMQTILNVYRGLFELQESILTGTSSLVSQVRDENKVINKIHSFNNNLLLDITDEHTYDGIPWIDDDKLEWSNDHRNWNVLSK